MPVLKQTSPVVDVRAPKEKPENSVPSSKTNLPCERVRVVKTIAPGLCERELFVPPWERYEEENGKCGIPRSPG